MKMWHGRAGRNPRFIQANPSSSDKLLTFPRSSMRSIVFADQFD
jgi:hypothetical protein